MNIIAIANQKGGVAKTTTAVNLSAGLGGLGNEVLLVDSDPQANASSHLGLGGKETRQTLDNLYYEQQLKAKEAITGRKGIDIIPAAQPLAYAEQKLSGIPAKEKILGEKLEPIQHQYEYIIIDCPPNLGFLTMNAFAAATDMLVVVKPEYFALEGLRRISRIAGMVRERLNPNLSPLRYLIANADGRKSQHSAVKKSLRDTFGDRVMETAIRTNAPLSSSPPSAERNRAAR